MAWPNMPDHAIATAIFGQYALLPRVQPTPPQLVEPEGTTTQRATDIRFLRRLAERNGFECYVAPEPLKELSAELVPALSSPWTPTISMSPRRMTSEPKTSIASTTGAFKNAS